MQVILPALRSDLADIPLPSDILSHARSEPVHRALSCDSSIRDAVAQITLSSPSDAKADFAKEQSTAITGSHAPVSAPLSQTEAPAEDAGSTADASKLCSALHWLPGESAAGTHV